MHTDNMFLHLVELLIEFLNQVLVRWLHSVCQAQLLTILFIVDIILDLSILLQSLLSIFNQLVCVLAYLWLEFWRLLRGNFAFGGLLILIHALPMHWIRQALLLTFVTLESCQTRRRLLKARGQRLIIILLNKPFHLLLKFDLLEPLLALLEEHARLLVDFRNAIQLLLMQLLLLGNLLLDALLLEESLLVGDEGLDVADLGQIIVMSRFIGSRAAYIGGWLLHLLTVLGCVRFYSSLLSFSLVARSAGRDTRPLLGQLGRKAALLHFLPFFFDEGEADLFLLLALLLGVFALPLLNVKRRFVLLLELVNHHVFLGDEQVRALLVVELLHKFIVCPLEIFGSFDSIF